MVWAWEEEVEGDNLSGRVRCTRPLDAGTKQFHRSGDPLVAALYLADTADPINTELLVSSISHDASFADGYDGTMSEFLSAYLGCSSFTFGTEIAGREHAHDSSSDRSGKRYSFIGFSFTVKGEVFSLRS